MFIWLILALAAASLQVMAVQQNNRKLEFLAKPAALTFLLIWLYASTGLQGNTFWFGLGILLSLAGDVILINPSDRMFLLGLFTFLCTHISYLIGFQDQLLNFTAWSLILIFIVFLNGFRLLRRILGAMRAKGHNALMGPVILYSVMISLLLYAGISTIFDPAWKTSAAFFVSVGAFLFYLSDLVLAWNKFVSPLQNANTLNAIAYYLGQIGLIAGVISQSLP